MEKTRIQHLYDQYRRGSATREELDELTRLLTDSDRSEKITQWLDGMWEQVDQTALVDIGAGRSELILEKILQRKGATRRRLRRVVAGWTAAAACLLALLMYSTGPRNGTEPLMADHTETSADDFDPGTDRAVLTLGDGRELVLDGYREEQISDEPRLRVGSPENNILVHLADESWRAKEDDHQRYNELRTPVGGQYRVMLPDGTKVTLNASSRLRYPQDFGRGQRRVELEGEGYFEVASEADRPFLVRASAFGNEQDVRVLGTEFNINTYDHGASIVTTVASGSVAVASTSGDQMLLTPGQESVLSASSYGEATLRRQPADLTETLAWVDGLFVFNSEPLPKLLNRVSRWYGVTFVFENDLSDVEFQGNYFRNKGLLNLLKNLETAGKVKFTTGGTETGERRIYVTRV